MLFRGIMYTGTATYWPSVLSLDTQGQRQPGVTCACRTMPSSVPCELPHKRQRQPHTLDWGAGLPSCSTGVRGRDTRPSGPSLPSRALGAPASH